MAGRKWYWVPLFCFMFLSSGNSCPAQEPLTLWTINPGTSFGNLTDRAVQAFSSENRDFSLTSIHFDNNYYKIRLRTAFEHRQAPDLFHHWGAESIRSYVQQGHLAPLDELVAHLRDSLLPVAFAPVTFDGKVYGVPYSGLTGVYFWYRRDVFAAHGLRPPKTWQEFIQVGETLKRNGIIPVALANKNKWPGSFFYMYLVDRIGGPLLFHEAVNRLNNRTFNHPAFVKAGELLVDLVERDFFPDGFNRSRDESGNWHSLFVSGQAGMYLMGSWFLSVLSEVPPEIRASIDFFVFPVVEGGAGSSRSVIGSPGQDYLSVSADSRQLPTAMAFLRDYICTPQYFRELAKQGFVPPVTNAADYLDDPLAKKVADTFLQAEHVQLYWNQVLPSTMAEAHKLLVHQLLELQITPEQAAGSHEDLLRNAIAPRGGG